MATEKKVRVKDKRKGRFMVDNVVLNGYGKLLGSTGIAFYVTLCRYTNRDTQQCYPSITTISQETKMKRNTIIKAAKKCVEMGLIKKKVFPGKYTLYTLLEPKKPPVPKRVLVEKGYSSGTKRVHKRMKIERTNNKYLAEPENNSNGESSPYIKTVAQILKIKKSGAAHEWQDYSVRMAKGLGFKPDKAWFKFIRDNFKYKRHVLDRTYTQIADLTMDKPDLYFYKVFYKNLEKG